MPVPDRSQSGVHDTSPSAPTTAAAPTPTPTADASCPHLGFSTNPALHLPDGPTAVHRCYALEQPARVSMETQAALCLTGGFAGCPRYRAATAGEVGRSDEELRAVLESPWPAVTPAASEPGGGVDARGGAARLTAKAPTETAREEERPAAAVISPVASPSHADGETIHLPTEAARLGSRPPWGRVSLVPVVGVVGVVAVAILATVLVMRGLSAPDTVPAVAPGAAPTATTVATAAAVATAPAGARGLVLDERFTSNQRGWPDDPQGTAWLAPAAEGGGYRLSARTPGHFVAVGVPPAAALDVVRDVVVTASFRKVGGPPGGGYGLILRDQGPGPRDGLSQAGRYYVFEAGDRGEFGVWRREDDRWIDVIPWTPTAAVRPGGAPNDLAVQVTGDRLAFRINGTLVGTVDATLPPGAVGVFVGGDSNDVALVRLTIEVPG